MSGSGGVDRQVTETALLRDLLGEPRSRALGGLGQVQWSHWAWLGVLVSFLAAFAPLALVAGEAGLAAASVRAPALGVAVAALVEVGAADLLSEDVYHVLLLAWVGTRRGQALQEVVASVVGLDLGVLGLSWELLEESSVDLALEELVSAGGSGVLGRSSGLQLGSIITSLCLILWLGCEKKLAWSDSLANAAHFASLMEDLKAWALSLSCLGYLSEDLLGVDWRLLGRWLVMCSPVERTVWHIVLSSHSEDAASRLRLARNGREDRRDPVFRAGVIFLDTWSLEMLVALTRLLVGVHGLGSEAVLRIEEGRSLHDATHYIFVAWSLEQVEESVGDVFADALILRAVLVRRREHSTGLKHSVTVLIVLLCLVVEDSAAVDGANGCKLGVLAQDLGIVVW